MKMMMMGEDLMGQKGVMRRKRGRIGIVTTTAKEGIRQEEEFEEGKAKG